MLFMNCSAYQDTKSQMYKCMGTHNESVSLKFKENPGKVYLWLVGGGMDTHYIFFHQFSSLT